MNPAEHEYGKTKLTEEEWLKVAAKRYGAYVLVIDGKVRAEGKWLHIVGQFLLSTKAGDRVKVMSHTDFVTRRLAECLLVSL
jgi:hypothetical protein